METEFKFKPFSEMSDNEKKEFFKRKRIQRKERREERNKNKPSKNEILKLSKERKKQIMEKEAQLLIECKSSCTPLEIDAVVFAFDAHKSHRRKYTDEPYIVHPRAVSLLVKSVPHTREMLCAAWLHDTVEDCDWITNKMIEDRFGKEVAELVEMLTDVSKPSDGNRAERRAIDRAHTSKASPEAKTIKLADLIDNTRSIVEHDRAFAKVYLAEKVLLLEVLEDGDADLFDIALKQVIEANKLINY